MYLLAEYPTSSSSLCHKKSGDAEIQLDDTDAVPNMAEEIIVT